MTIVRQDGPGIDMSKPLGRPHRDTAGSQAMSAAMAMIPVDRRGEAARIVDCRSRGMDPAEASAQRPAMMYRVAQDLASKGFRPEC